MTIAPEAPDHARNKHQQSHHRSEHFNEAARIATGSAMGPERPLTTAEFAWREVLEDRRVLAAMQLLHSRDITKAHYGLDEITWQPPSPYKYPDIFRWDQTFTDEMLIGATEFCWDQAAFYTRHLEQTQPQDWKALERAIEEFDRLGDLFFDTAIKGEETLLSTMDEIGNLPNSTVLTGSGVGQAGLERLIIKKQGENKASAYTQPVLEPMVIHSAYEVAAKHDPVRAKAVVERFYDQLAVGLGYFDNVLADTDPNRRFEGEPDPDAPEWESLIADELSSVDVNSRLAGVPHLHATGRDSDHVGDHAKKRRLKRKGPQTGKGRNLANALIDYGYALKGTRDIVKAGDIHEMRQKYWDRDVMFNCIYLDNLYEMAELAKILGKDEDEEHYLNLAEQLEAEIQTMWKPDAWHDNGAFLNLDKDYNQIPEVSITSLFGLTLRSLTAEQLESMLNLFEESFNTPVGIPSIPTDSPNYDPHYGEKGRLWRGPSWDNVNWYLVERGFCMQAQREDMPLELRQRCVRYATKVAESSSQALDKSFPPSEFRDPEDGRPLRTKTQMFAWANLPYFMLTPYKLQHLLESDSDTKLADAA